jgi:pyruvate formate lyase activating enzyme
MSKRTGIVFDIREFTVHDGPGIRTTVFMKGCPLRCAWCHNPEGMSPCPETIQNQNGKRLVGKKYTADELAALLNRQSAILQLGGGGVTFSGGEPLSQASYVSAVIDQLRNMHVLLDTSGYARESDFELVARKCDLVYFDLKLARSEEHRRFTGVDNSLILRNLASLSRMGIPFVIRIPLIPGVTDSDENLHASAQLIAGQSQLVRVDLLPYNRAAGGKYASLGKQFMPPYDENQPVNINLTAFEQLGIPIRVAGLANHQ